MHMNLMNVFSEKKENYLLQKDVHICLPHDRNACSQIYSGLGTLYDWTPSSPLKGSDHQQVNSTSTSSLYYCKLFNSNSFLYMHACIYNKYGENIQSQHFFGQKKKVNMQFIKKTWLFKKVTALSQNT